MMSYESMKGLSVITMAEGKQIGKVDELVVDPERKVVSWLRLHSGGIGGLGGERLWVSTQAVHGVGEDAVTINAEADAVPPAAAPEALALVKAKREIIGNKVITESGERFGEVFDYEFDPETFALTSLSVSPGMNIEGEMLTIASDKVLTIGEDVIVVSSDVLLQQQSLDLSQQTGDPVADAVA